MKLKSYEIFLEGVHNDQHMKYYMGKMKDELELSSNVWNFNNVNYIDYDMIKFTCGINKDVIRGIKRTLDRYSRILLKSNIYMVYNHFDHDTDRNYFKVFFKSLYTQRVKPRKSIYHVSRKKNRKSIFENGLQLKSHSESESWSESKQFSYPPAVFATNSEKGFDDIWSTDGSGDVWEIDTTNLPNKWWFDLNFYWNNEYQQFKHIMTFEPIPAKYLKLIRLEDQ